MDYQQNETGIRDSGAKLLSSLIVEFNIARRNIGSYPKDHPLITASLNKVINTYNRLLEQDNEIVIGVARDALIINSTRLEENNPVFIGFAKVLFEHGIGALTLRRGLSLDELGMFYEILHLKREELLNRGGISPVWEQASITSLDIQPIRYDLFCATDPAFAENQPKPAQGLWERFALELIKGRPGLRAARQIPEENRDKSGASDTPGPEALASILNQHMGITGQGEDADFHNGLSALLQECSGYSLDPETELDDPSEELAAFINALNPGLRRLFLNNGIEVGVIADNPLTEKLISRFSAETMSEILEDANQNRFTEPLRILEILKKLGSDTTQRYGSLPVIAEDMAEAHRKIQIIFREDPIEAFAPASYQKALDRLMTFEHGHRIERSEITGLLETLDSRFVEKQISDIIVRIMVQNTDPEQMARLAANLDEMFHYLLETGDYEQIIHLIEQCTAPEIIPEVRASLRQTYTSQAYLNEMLAGLSTWGKSRYGEITHLIGMIGEPFIEVLLDRLADEETMSLRRFLTDRIQEFGPLARDALISRLSDKRWFVLRNVIIMLRQLEDNTILEHIRPLLRNDHQRVRQEALRTCLYFNDPVAERQILRDMDSPVRETQLAAINLIEKNCSVTLFKKLLSIIGKPGLSAIECELKSAAVQALAETGRPEALPELSRLLASKSLLHPRSLTRLKLDVVRSLCHYPSTTTQPLLTNLASGNGKVAQQARVSLKMILEKTT